MMLYLLAASCAAWAALATAARTSDHLSILGSALCGAALLFAASMGGFIR